MANLPFLSYLRGIYKLNLNKSSRVHQALIQSIYDCFIRTQEDINLMRLEMCLKTATGYWLNCWGEFFSVYRKSGEDDETYSQRIIGSIIQPKSTIPAIKDSIVNYLNLSTSTEYTKEDIRIREPWRELAKYSHKGVLSKDARFCSSDYYCHAVLDISIPENITQELIDIVASVKAAGIKVMWSSLNQYEIIDNFYKSDESWANYHRRFQLEAKDSQYFGLVLSSSGPRPVLSGVQKLWYSYTSYYDWFAKVLTRQVDNSILISKKDLIGLIDYFLDVESLTEEYNPYLEPHMILSQAGRLSTSDAKIVQTIPENWVKITEELLSTLEQMDTFLTISDEGKLSSPKASLFEYTSSHKLFGELMKAVEDFKKVNPEYYNSVQSPILNGEQAMWFVERNINSMIHHEVISTEELYESWIDEHKEFEQELTSVIEFENACEQNYITIDDSYQSSISIGKPFYWTVDATRSGTKDWVFDSQILTIEDLEQFYVRQMYTHGITKNDEMTLGDIFAFEETELEYGYSVVEDEQSLIEINSVVVN